MTSQTGSIVVILLLLLLQSAAAFAPMQKYQANAQHTIANNTSGSNGDLSNLSNNNGYSELPQVTASGNNVYVVWLDDTPGSRDVFLRRSTDGGVVWNETVSNGTEGDSFDQRIVAVQSKNKVNEVYVVWIEYAINGNEEIHLRRSTDGGNTFDNSSGKLGSGGRGKRSC